MSYQEQAQAFECGNEWLYGIISVPERPAQRGVLIVVGGPQYRAGSHRQFTLLARSLASQGIAALRFDYRGMGDSQGSLRDFENVQDDLRAAVDHFTKAVPEVREVVIWGLCDAASAALFYAGSDPRVTGLVLLNPWVRTADGYAKTTIKHYYRNRLFSGGLWRKILSGRFDYRAALASLVGLVRTASGRSKDGTGKQESTAATLPERMLSGWEAFRGRVLLVLSGNDLTAKEFTDMAAASERWQRHLRDPRVTRQALESADHTFSRREWRDQVADWTSAWVRSW